MSGAEGQPPRPTLGDPLPAWRDDGTPVSELFGDVYFAEGSGLSESHHVFLDGCGLPDAWSGRNRFVIGETGFGTGLNFLAAWNAWRRHPSRCDILDFVSVEGFPMTPPALARSLAQYAELAPLARQLVEAWPVRHPGQHLLSFEQGRVRLTLLLGPVEEMLGGLRAKVDCWFLDGFAPSRNPEMWTQEVLRRVAELSRPGARVATFTAAGAVRRGLTDVGFEMTRRPGHGYKRECLSGILVRPAAASEAPWFRLPDPLSGGTVAVIGAGIGGCTVARALGRAGFKVVLVDRSGIGGGASGNPSAMLKPRLTADGGLHSRFYGSAFLAAVRALDDLEREGAGAWRSRGVLSLARDQDEAASLSRMAGGLPPEHAKFLNSDEATERSGVPADRGGLWFPYGGVIDPLSVCRAVAEGVPVVAAAVARIDRFGGRHRLWSQEGRHLLDADGVVLAAGPEVPRLWPAAELPIRANRGQITVLTSAERPRSALSFGGYVAPQDDDLVIGATYDRWGNLDDVSWRELREEDHQRNIAQVADAVPALLREPVTICGGRASLRATIADHMPMVGPLFDAQKFRMAYSDLHHGRPFDAYVPAPWEEGLFVLGALGSRGFQTAFLLAETLAAMMSGAPVPLPSDILEALSPARFIVRDLKQAPRHRKQVSGTSR